MVDEQHRHWASPLSHTLWAVASTTGIAKEGPISAGTIIGFIGLFMTFLIHVDAIVTGLIRLAFMAQKLWRLARHGRKPQA